MFPAYRIRVIIDAETVETTWSEFCADNLEGFDQDQLDQMATELCHHGETDISHLMHCGERCVLTCAH